MGSILIVVAVVVAVIVGVVLYLRRSSGGGGTSVAVSWRRTRFSAHEGGPLMDGISVEVTNTGSRPVTFLKAGFDFPDGKPVPLPPTVVKFPQQVAPGATCAIFFADSVLNSIVRTYGNPGQQIAITPHYDDAERRVHRGKAYTITIRP